MRMSPHYFILIIWLAIASSLHAQQSSTKEDGLVRREDSVKAALNQPIQDSIKFKLLLGLINLYQDVQPQKSFQWIEKGKAIAANSKDYNNLLLFHTMEMRTNSRLALYEQAMLVAERAAYLLKEKKVQPRISAGYHLQKGQVLYKMAAYDKSATEFNLAADIAKQYQLADVEVKVLINLTLVQEALERYPEMRVQFLKALVIADKAGLGEDAANIKVNLALLESRTNNYGKAIEYLNDALPYYQSHHNDVSVALCYANLAYGYLQIKEYPKALQQAYESFAIRTKLNDQGGIAKLHIILGQVYMETGKFDSSLAQLNSGIALATKLSMPQYLKDGYSALAKLYERTKQYQAAYESLQHYNEWKDTLFQKDKQKQLIQQLNLYKAKYVDSLVQQKDIAIGKQKSTINFLWILAGVFLLALLLTVLWRYRKKQIHVIEEQSNEYANTEKNQLKEEVERLNGEVKLLQANLKQETREDLLNLRKLVQESNLQTEGYWNEFLLLFSKVYPNFFEQLKTDYPQLTQNELRICSLMKLNLSLLEIANLLNVTPESGRKARYRIYKKMNLTSDKDFVEKILLF